MAEVQQEIWQTKSLDSKELLSNLMFVKAEALDRDMDDLKKRMDKFEQENLVINDQLKNILFYEEARRKTSVKKTNNTDSVEPLQECREISKRAIEILTKWSGTQDIKMQVQFAAITVGKIDNLKKNIYIQSDEVKRKVCTLLRNVIRLNVADEVFSQEQIELLKKGFLLLVTDDVKKEDLLQLNRELRKKKLITMPSWE